MSIMNADATAENKPDWEITVIAIRPKCVNTSSTHEFKEEGAARSYELDHRGQP